jgi:hypothetical protein
VRRRDAYDGTPTAVAAVDIEHLLDVSVKVAAGTPPVNIPPSQYRWIQQNPEVAGAAMGQQLAVDMFADMLNTSLLSASAALGQQAALTTDKSGEATPTATFSYLLDATRAMGDRAQEVTCWVMHSKPMFDLHAEALSNSASLFSYGTVNVMSDPFGRVFVVTDSPSLHYTDVDEHYRTLGLRPGAIVVGQNNDYEDNWDTTNGYENIQRTYQAEWSFNVGVNGFAWDKANGLANPGATELGTGTNWDPYYSDQKDAAGVLLVTL